AFPSRPVLERFPGGPAPWLRSGLLEHELPLERLAHHFLRFRLLFVRQEGLDLPFGVGAKLRQLLVPALTALGDLLQLLAGLLLHLLELLPLLLGQVERFGNLRPVELPQAGNLEGDLLEALALRGREVLLQELLVLLLQLLGLLQGLLLG